MEVDDIPQIDPNVDYNLIQPIHQKRTIAFVNHFLLSTVSFMNQFVESCESRLMKFEYKLQKIEATLLILESQLSSIPDLNDVDVQSTKNMNLVAVDLPEVPLNDIETNEDVVDDHTQNAEQLDDDNEKIERTESKRKDEKVQEEGTKASSDPRFSKFFKMLQFGVPAQAVRLKMDLEGINPKILDEPNAVIP